MPGEKKTTVDLLDQLLQIIDELYDHDEAKVKKNEIRERNKDKQIKYVEDSNLAKHYEDAKRMGIYSLSEKRDQILMWSHYADHHKGFCIEFQRDDSEYNFLSHFMCRPVSYKEKYPNLNRILDTFEINLYTKAIDWRYESEWRLVFKEGGRLFQVPASITGIIFGLRLSDENKSRIKEAIPNNKSVTFYQASRKPGAFAIEINQIESVN